MPNISVKFNQSIFNKNFNKNLDKNIFKKLAYRKMQSIFGISKYNLLTRFRESDITQEILSGPLAENISNTLDGYGNLFSFIGFNSSEPNPILNFEEFLNKNITFQSTVRRDKTWYFKVNTPNEKEIADNSQMIWETDSWVLGIEDGISGLSHYMYKHWANGYSKEGFQLPYENQDELNFSTKPYLRQMLKDFRESFNK